MAYPRPVNGSVRFGVFELDLGAGELRKHGIRIKLQEQPFQVLQILIERPGEVVSREELQRRLWPLDTFVEFDKGIYNAIKRLRETLTDDAENPRYVETVPRRGYRFVGSLNGASPGTPPVEPQPSSPIQTVSHSKPRLITGFAVAGVGTIFALVLLLRAWRTGPAESDTNRVPALKILRLTDSGSENPVHYAAISPDGKHLAYTDATGIHVKIIETGEVRTILPPADSQTGPSSPDFAAPFPVAWFPDGSKLLVSTKTGPTVWSISLIAGSTRKLYSGGWGSGVSPDGSWIAIVKKDAEVWLMGSHGEEARQVAMAETGSAIGRVFWSPDSGRIAYMKIYYKPQRLECALESRNLVGGEPTVLLTDTKLCQEQAQSFWWAPDGRILFSLREIAGDSNLWEIRTDSRTGKPLGTPKRLTNWAEFAMDGINGSADGKRLIFLRSWFPNDVEIAELDSREPARLRAPRPLTTKEHTAWPTAWTPDSRAVVYHTAKSGNNDIYKQALDKESPEPIIVSPGEQLSARLSPDGSSLIFMDLPSFWNFGPSTLVRLMRLPFSGGTPELVLTTDRYSGYNCPRNPASFCVLGERSPDERRLVFFAFHAMQTITPGTSDGGKGRELLSVDTESGRSYGWDLSPDGSLLAVSKIDEHEIRIRFISLKNSRPYEVNVHGWARLNGMNWSADSRSLFISSRTPSRAALLQVDLQGRAHVLWQQKAAYQIWAVPSPDGRLLAILNATERRDVWMAENF